MPEWVEDLGYEDGTFGEWMDEAPAGTARNGGGQSSSNGAFAGDALGCDALGCDALGCDALGCDALGCDALGCDSIAGCDGCGQCASRNPGICGRAQLTGDWCGCRSHLQESGITYRGRLTQFFFGVDGGIQDDLLPPAFKALGLEGGDTFEYTGNAQHDFLVDLDKFGGLPHSKFVVTLEHIWGRFGNVSLETGASTPAIFNAFMPVDFEAEGVPRLTNFLYVQPLSEQLIVSVGKVRLAGTADRNIFAGGDGSDQFLNQSFVANPLYVGQLPLSAFSISAVMPRAWGNILFSVIDPRERSAEYFEFDTLFADGVMMFGQIKVNTNFFCKPGEHHIGGYYKNVDLLDLRFSPLPPTYPYPPAPPGTPAFATKDDSYTIFYGFDQYVGVFGKPDAQGNVPGWGVFGRAGISDGGGGNPNFDGWHVSAGIGGDSLLASRRDKGDRFGVGYAYTGTSDAWGAIPTSLFGPRDSQALEAYYRYQVTPAISVSPDVQWVRGLLGGLSGGKDAFIYGLRLNMHL